MLLLLASARAATAARPLACVRRRLFASGQPRGVPEEQQRKAWRTSVPEGCDVHTVFMAPPLIAPEQPASPRALNVAVVGVPNVGKSTLVNALVGAKISIVSPRAQTTREQTRGVLTEGNTQIV
jgi:ribosome biogenesis GTPase A